MHAAGVSAGVMQADAFGMPGSCPDKFVAPAVMPSLIPSRIASRYFSQRYLRTVLSRIRWCIVSRTFETIRGGGKERRLQRRCRTMGIRRDTTCRLTSAVRLPHKHPRHHVVHRFAIPASPSRSPLLHAGKSVSWASNQPTVGLERHFKTEQRC